MSSIVYQKSKYGKTYAYRSESFWDKEKKAPRSKRTYLGVVDPETGDIITGKRKAKQEEIKIRERAPEDIENAAIRELKEEVIRLNEKNASLTDEVCTLREQLQKTRRMIKLLSEDLDNAASLL